MELGDVNDLIGNNTTKDVEPVAKDEAVKQAPATTTATPTGETVAVLVDEPKEEPVGVGKGGTCEKCKIGKIAQYISLGIGGAAFLVLLSLSYRLLRWGK